MRYALVVSLSLTLLLAAVAVAQVYPIRWDDDEPALVTAEVTTPGSAVMAGLRLVPQDDPPVVCGATTEGYLYVQKDTAGASAAYSSVLCVCTEDEVGGGFKFYSTGNNPCSNFDLP